MPVFWFGSVLPCAVIVLTLFGGFLANMLQFWKTAAALPNMKSTVP
jgi:hypothetical protein